MTRLSSPALLVKRFRGGTRWESVFLPGLFSVTHHSLSCRSAPGQCLIHGLRKSWMHQVQKPLASSCLLSIFSSTSSPLNRHPDDSTHLVINHPPFYAFVSSQSSCFTWFSLLSLFSVTSLLSPHIPRAYVPPPLPCTCSHSCAVHWCHLSASSETQHIKISVSLARTFRPSWIIHIHISAPHLLTSREVLLPHVMKSGWPLLYIYIYIYIYIHIFSLAWSSHWGGFNGAEVIRGFWKIPRGRVVDTMSSFQGEKRCNSGGMAVE